MSDAGSVNEWIGIAEKQERGEDNCIPRIYMREVPDVKASEVAGRPKFRLVPFIEIINPGDKLHRINCKVTDEHKKRWPDAWAKFEKSQQETLGEGTPLEAWPYLNRAQVAEFKAIGILYVESLANLGETGLNKIGMGARHFQKRAQQFLKPQTDRETELRAQVQTLEGMVRERDMTIEHLKRVVEAQPKNKGGRPRKVVDDELGNDL